MATAKSTEKYTEKDLPKAGSGRWWEISHNPKSRTNPITIRLMEQQVPGRKALSRAIGFEYTTASWKALAEAAELVLARTGDYAKVVGDYQVEER
jgi:hypothetical protein